ncbi:MAG: hypothetical protein JNM39_07020 [Bdellovibrionaceae bacterium]|nr:hypothetical protein [Pseudobdellovibrionaceae bacterium]
METCPRCGNQVSALQLIDSDLLGKLQESGESPSSNVCGTCLSEYHKSLNLSKGGILFAQEKAKEQHRLQLWKSRVGLIKRARALMSRKMYNEAAVSYEKYLRILEIVFDCKKGEHLTPNNFKDSARTSELTVVTSVYWDLLRIYDSSDKYLERQQIAARQLAIFVQFTPILPDIIKRAEAFLRNAKHPQVIKSFLKASAQQRPRCFVATAVYEDPLAREVQILRWYRDFYLKKTPWGRGFVKFYYKVSPTLAIWINRTPSQKPLLRAALGGLIWLIGCVSRRTDGFDLA